QMEELPKRRHVRRERRDRGDVAVVSIVGYTNAGKSTLFNSLTAADVLVEDKLFATLDPTSRRLELGVSGDVVLTDTVGFIRDLPKDLVNAFRATLEELSEADLLVHVVDAADPDYEAHVVAVERILDELGLAETPRLVVLNKVDLLPAELPAGRLDGRGGRIGISATRAESTHGLLAGVERELGKEEKLAADDLAS